MRKVTFQDVKGNLLHGKTRPFAKQPFFYRITYNLTLLYMPPSAYCGFVGNAGADVALLVTFCYVEVPALCFFMKM